MLRRGSAEAVATRLAVPLDEVNPANALGLLAACPARVVLGRLPTPGWWVSSWSFTPHRRAPA